jgi:hypothetical protein
VEPDPVNYNGLIHDINEQAVIADIVASKGNDDEVQMYLQQGMPLHTLQGMAGQLRRTMLAVQPHGLYRIDCPHDNVARAFEPARRLLGEDRLVEFVGILGNGPGMTDEHVNLAPATSVLRFANGSLA